MILVDIREDLMKESELSKNENVTIIGADLGKAEEIDRVWK